MTEKEVSGGFIACRSCVSEQSPGSVRSITYQKSHFSKTVFQMPQPVAGESSLIEGFLAPVVVASPFFHCQAALFGVKPASWSVP